MADLDRLLDLLDQATQRPGDAAYPPEFDGAAELCWRCLAASGEGQAGVCPSCREVLLDETYAAPADAPSWPQSGLVTLTWDNLTSLVYRRDGEVVFEWTQPHYDDSDWATVDDEEPPTMTPGMVIRTILAERPEIDLGPALAKMDFEEAYAARSRITVEHAYAIGIFPAVPCDCDGETCEGWRRRYEDDGPA